MTKLAAVEVVLLAAWIGAAVLVATVVAPAAFRVLPSRALAGAVVGEVLPVIFIAGLIVGALAVAIESRDGARFTRPAVAGPFIALILGCLIAQFVVGPKIEAVRVSIGGAVDGLETSDPRRVQFGRLHAFSVMWMAVAMLGALWALIRKTLTASSFVSLRTTETHDHKN
jgi:hypothetical protein